MCPIHAPTLGGVERAALRLCTEWSRDADVTVVLGRHEGRVPVDPTYAIDLDEARWFPRRACETPWMMWRLARAVLRQRPDVIFCPGNTYAVVVVVLRLLLGRRCPPVVAKISNSLARADLPAAARPLYRLWCRLQSRLIDQLVAMSQAAADEVTAVARVPRTTVAVIASPALDAALHRRLAALPLPVRTGEGRVLLAVGRLVGQKNVALLIDAFAASGRAATDHLMIAGDGPQAAALRRRIAARGVARAVTLLGHRDDVPALLARADALVLSSDYEGVPAVVIEALAAGRPVIATNCAVSMRELLGGERRGLLVPPRDLPALAGAIAAWNALPFDPAEARAFAAGYTSDAAAGRYLALFGTLPAARERTASLPPARIPAAL